MADVVSPSVRSRMMAGIRSKDTRPEIVLRRLLHGMGFRYRLHDKRLPGKPDIVFPKYHAVIFVHGCFWHGHRCNLFKWPSSNREFWENKINSNIKRDEINKNLLKNTGWRVAIIWECAMRKNGYTGDEVSKLLGNWLKSDSDCLEIDK